MARTTISIPDALKARMDAITESVNWSQVAAVAFELHLGKIATARKEKDKSALVSRLRASKITRGDKDYADGFRSGGHWAEDEASYAHLDNMSKIYETRKQDFDFDSDSPITAKGVAQMTSVTDYGDWLPRYEIITAFWEKGVFNMTPLGPYEKEAIANRNWLRGFVEGAVSVFESVKEDL